VFHRLGLQFFKFKNFLRCANPTAIQDEEGAGTGTTVATTPAMQAPTSERDPDGVTHDSPTTDRSEDSAQRSAVQEERSASASARAERPHNKAHLALIGALSLTVLVCLAVFLFMSMHPHPVDEGKIRGPGDEAAPNAPPDYKYR